MNDLSKEFYEMYKEFCRLKGYKMPVNRIEVMIDEATGAEEAHMKEFAEWVKTELLPGWKLVP